MYIGKEDNKIVYEVELANPENLMVLGQKANRSNLEQEVKKHTIKLLLFEDEKTKKILYASYMSLEKHSKGEFDKLHYKNLGNFTGTVLYYHFTGQLANGWNYTNGRIAEKIAVITEKQFDQLQTQTQGDIRTEAIICQSGFADKYQWTCVGVPGYENCGFTYIGQEYVTYCSYEEEDKDYLGNENESGGGYFPPEYTDCAGVAGGTAIWNNECNTCIGGTTGLTACPPREIIDSLQGFPCAQSILSELPKLNDTIAKIIQSTFGGTAHKLIIKPKSASGSMTDGWHTPKLTLNNGYNFSAGYSVTSTIEINEDVLNYATKDYILVTIYHEALHAFLNVEKNRLGANFSNVYPDVNPLYINGPSGQIDLTKAIFVSNHSVMAVNFLDKLEKALMQYNTNLSTSDPDVIKAICSAGILNQSNAQRLLNSAERDTRQNNFKGKKC
ncbi:hypothetical protein [Pedobacter sp. SL55]|uniref:hypothetical protein n=1 Tax=Pedobacter sp. SL55 TaxID=2995161 RepID=UPI00226E3450|nr:hypothetical protein [Pedobacter sp. SL55]WAC42158.1 hypothetical protein OVA16_07340 [Pedobacter sp. SL55]